MECRVEKPAVHPHQRWVEYAGQCGVEVEGRRLPTHAWWLNLQILTLGGSQPAAETCHHEMLWRMDFFSVGRRCGSGEESETVQISFGPAGTDEKIANNVGGRVSLGRW